MLQHHTKPAVQTIQDQMICQENGWSCQEADRQSWKRWISGLFNYRVTPQSDSITSLLQLMTQHTPREKNLPQLPNVLSAPEMHQTYQELIKRQGNKPERTTLN